MSTLPTHRELASWLSDKKYLSENCHDAEFSGSLGKVINGALSPEQETALLENTFSPPSGSTAYKEGERSFVGACPIADTTLALKYYHRLNLRRQIGYTMFGSHAQKAWKASRVLTKLNIPTPQPIALLEYKKLGIITDTSLLVTEVVEGIPLPEYIKKHAEDEQKMTHIKDSCKKIFDRLAEYRIYHSDTSAKNFIVKYDNTLSIIDLDAAEILVPKILWKSKRAKDKFRFMRIFGAYRPLKAIFEDVFKND